MLNKVNDVRESLIRSSVIDVVFVRYWNPVTDVVFVRYYNGNWCNILTLFNLSVCTNMKGHLNPNYIVKWSRSPPTMVGRTKGTVSR